MKIAALPNTKKGILKKASREAWEYQERCGRGGGREYSLESLPENARKEIIEGLIGKSHDTPTSENTESLQTELQPWQKEIADKREALVKDFQKASEHFPAKFKTKCAHKFAQDHGVSVGTLRRFIVQYQSGGYESLAPGWSNGDRKRLIDKALAKLIADAYLQPYGPTVKQVWEALCKEFGQAREHLPSYRTVHDYINATWTKSQQLLIRDKAAWNLIYSPYVRRDWDRCELNEVWIADSKQIDIACMFQGKPIFPWLVAIIEAKSRKYVSWILVPTANALAIGQAIVYAVSKFGPPKTFYFDRGKDYKSRHIAGTKQKKGTEEAPFSDIEETETAGILRELGCEIFWAAPYNPREKIIEANFGIFTDRLRELPGYRGHNIKTRPKKLAHEIKSQNLLAFEELSQKIDQLLNERNARPHATTKRVPDSYWENHQAVIPSKHLLDYLLMDVNFCTVRDSSVTVKGILYRHDDLFKLAGEKVQIRRDPKDISRAVVIYRCKIFCIALIERADHYRSEITLNSVRDCARIRRRIKKYRQYVMENAAVIEDPLSVAVELDRTEKVRQRDISPADSKVKTFHKREKLAREVAKGLKEEQCEEARSLKSAAGGSGRDFLSRYLDALPPRTEQKEMDCARMLGGSLGYNPNFRDDR